MGLDMWLIKKQKSKGVEVAYWRKANAIHGWFVDNIQDGVDDQNEYYVSKEKLEELLNLCKKINEMIVLNEKGGVKNIGEIEELLPVCEGFFFGDYSYSSWYVDDIKDTIEQLTKVLQTTDFEKEKILYTCWW